MFLRPILNAYQGVAVGPVTMPARLEQALPANGSREHWMRAKLTYMEGGVAVRPYRDQDSSLVSVFAASDALLRRLAGAAAAEAGSVVEVLPLSRA
jgi:molybdopterin molybdotransferase